MYRVLFALVLLFPIGSFCAEEKLSAHPNIDCTGESDGIKIRWIHRPAKRSLETTFDSYRYPAGYRAQDSRDYGVSETGDQYEIWGLLATSNPRFAPGRFVATYYKDVDGKGWLKVDSWAYFSHLECKTIR